MATLKSALESDGQTIQIYKPPVDTPDTYIVDDENAAEELNNYNLDSFIVEDEGMVETTATPSVGEGEEEPESFNFAMLNRKQRKMMFKRMGLRKEEKRGNANPDVELKKRKRSRSKAKKRSRY